jgi:hypothetical protein
MLTKLILAATAAALGSFAVSSVALADGETKQLNNNSFQEYAFALCNTSESCRVTFPPTTYATTVVKAVSCLVNATPGSFAGIALGTSAGEQTFYMQAFIFQSFSDGLSVTVNAATNLFFNKGDSPHVDAFVSNGGAFFNSLVCTITGEHS